MAIFNHSLIYVAAAISALIAAAASCYCAIYSHQLSLIAAASYHISSCLFCCCCYCFLDRLEVLGLAFQIVAFLWYNRSLILMLLLLGLAPSMIRVSASVRFYMRVIPAAVGAAYSFLLFILKLKLLSAICFKVKNKNTSPPNEYCSFQFSSGSCINCHFLLLEPWRAVK